MTIKTKRVQNGLFSVYNSNNEITEYQIINGSLGMSGKVQWIGSLAKAKKVVGFWIQKSTN